MPKSDGTFKEVQTVTPAGEPVAALPAGVTFRDTPMHIDSRGSLRELYDLRWNWHAEPLVYAYCFTIRPGFIKGWGLHKLHEDRYFVLCGEMQVVLYDDRADSPTHKQVSSIVLSEYRSRLMNIPTGVWHANYNIGSKDAVVVNFPTRPYDHANPDKYHLPLNTSLIPYQFDNPRGG